MVRVVCGMLGAFTLSAVVHGQAGGATQPEARTTYTGCVERAEQLMTGGANTLGTSLDAMSFVLMRAEEVTPGAVGTAGSRGDGQQPGPRADASTGPGATAPSTAASPQSPVGPIVRLDGDDSLLNPHVGHEVEVTGAIRGDAAPSTPRPAGPSLATAPTLRVQSIRMIGETCPRGR